jgi:hypothetical protein
VFGQGAGLIRVRPWFLLVLRHCKSRDLRLIFQFWQSWEVLVNERIHPRDTGYTYISWPDVSRDTRIKVCEIQQWLLLLAIQCSEWISEWIVVMWANMPPDRVATVEYHYYLFVGLVRWPETAPFTNENLNAVL